MTGPSGNVEYAIDRDDCLCLISREWKPFAQANGGADLDPVHLLGRPLWRYISGQDTISLYQAVIESVRNWRRPATFPYRCDSPTVRRYLEMTISAQEDGRVLFVNRVIRIEPRRFTLAYTYGANLGEPEMPMCSICNRIRVEGDWMEVADAFDMRRLLDSDLPLNLVYQLCAPCRLAIHGRAGRA